MSVRLWQIQQEIEAKGHYSLTYEELVFGARTAWRNAPRCVNRIVWRQLEVGGEVDQIIDHRTLTTVAICHSLAFNRLVSSCLLEMFTATPTKMF